MTVAQGIFMIAPVVLVVAALLALYRLAKGPTSLDRAVASDVLIAVLIAAIACYTVWNRTPIALIIVLALSMLGFTSAVGLARLITRATIRRRRFIEADAHSAYEEAGQLDEVRQAQELHEADQAAKEREAR